MPLISDARAPPSFRGWEDAAMRVDRSRQLPVPHRFAAGCQSQIGPFVIDAISVFVVEVAKRFFAGHQFPNDTMRET